MIDQTILLAVLTFVAATVGTVSGFGISSIMIPVMSLFYPISTVLLFVAIIHLTGDLWKIILFKKGADWKLIAAFGIPGIILSYVGASISLSVNPDLLKRLLGIFLLLYVAYLFIKQKWKIPRTKVTSAVGGSLSGFFAGIFGVGGAIRGVFLSAYDLPKEMYLFTAGMIALFIDLTRTAKYLMGGMTLSHYLWILLLFLIPLSLLGAYLAKKIVKFVPQKSFRLLIAVFLGLIGLKFLIYP
jgi:uncharacterized protein